MSNNFHQNTLILMLLPKSGGAGLSFTNVVLNILLQVGWTHKDKEQCGGRNTRGSGIKYIGSPEYPFKSAIHVKNVVRKKELLSDLFLDMDSFEAKSLNGWIRKILDTAASIVMSKMTHCESNANWEESFEALKDDIESKISDGVVVWNEYQTLKTRKENIKNDEWMEDEWDEDSTVYNVTKTDQLTKKRRPNQKLSKVNLPEDETQMEEEISLKRQNSHFMNHTQQAPIQLGIASKGNSFSIPVDRLKENTGTNFLPMMSSNSNMTMQSNHNNGMSSYPTVNSCANLNINTFQNNAMTSFPMMNSNSNTNQNNYSQPQMQSYSNTGMGNFQTNNFNSNVGTPFQNSGANAYSTVNSNLNFQPNNYSLPQMQSYSNTGMGNFQTNNFNSNVGTPFQNSGTNAYSIGNSNLNFQQNNYLQMPMQNQNTVMSSLPLSNFNSNTGLSFQNSGANAYSTGNSNLNFQPTNYSQPQMQYQNTVTNSLPMSNFNSNIGFSFQNSGANAYSTGNSNLIFQPNNYSQPQMQYQNTVTNSLPMSNFNSMNGVNSSNPDNFFL